MKYTENHSLGDIISDHYQLLQVISRFGISCGFGDKSVRTICDKHNIDCQTFLAIINYTANGDTCGITDVAVNEMTNFLISSHHYFTDFCLPQLRNKLTTTLGSDKDKIAQLIIDFFDKYTNAVKKHLEHEDKMVFTYVNELCEGRLPDGELPMERYSRKHEQIDSMLTELKVMIIKYYPMPDNAPILNNLLYDIFAYENDLKSHCDIEDNLYIPAVIALVNKLKEVES